LKSNINDHREVFIHALHVSLKKDIIFNILLKDGHTNWQGMILFARDLGWEMFKDRGISIETPQNPIVMGV